ncbi:hypothetical protein METBISCDRAFT_21046 [Metschnikowia bicuspidata]|uniref:F-box domain-containing protein n=1 Tax=Metschnikowia bicuspidata TaxID=27322 RepID=A0A4P9ZIF9_9ASCO|nr:hypothetical protein METBISCDRAFT_21046 [Metschnikowia bicuspidata]
MDGFQWWQLPPEILDLIFTKLLPADYVKFYRLCNKKHFLNDPARLLAVLGSNFGAEIEAFEWDPVHDITTEQFTEAADKFSEFVSNVVKSLHGIANAEHHGHSVPLARDYRALLDLVTQVACSNTHPIVALHHLRTVDIEWNAQLSSIYMHSLVSPYTLNVAQSSWSRHMFHMQQFAACVRFFHRADPNTHRDLERCYFELSRCHLEFGLLAPCRVKKLRQLRTQVANFTGVHSGGLLFASSSAFQDYLRSVVFIILRILKPQDPLPTENGNLFRFYKGETRAEMEICLAVVGKILQEEVFDKIVLQTPEKRYSHVTVKISPKFIIAGDMYISLSQKDFSVSVYHEEQVLSLAASILRPLRYIDAVRTFSHIDSTLRAFQCAARSELVNKDWQGEKISTCPERLRFVRTLMISVCQREDLPMTILKTLTRYPDFYLYHACAKTLVGLLEEHDTVDSFIPALSAGDIQHSLFVNIRSHYLGIRLKMREDAASDWTSRDTNCHVLPIDSLEVSVAQEESIQSLGATDFGAAFPEFLRWLLCTEGVSLVTRFFLPRLCISESLIEFEEAEPAEQTGLRARG